MVPNIECKDTQEKKPFDAVKFHSREEEEEEKKKVKGEKEMKKAEKEEEEVKEVKGEEEVKKVEEEEEEKSQKEETPSSVSLTFDLFGFSSEPGYVEETPVGTSTRDSGPTTLTAAIETLTISADGFSEIPSYSKLPYYPNHIRLLM